MELKVWVEGIQRIVCGVTVDTTCQDVVFALAHATGKVGRFTLIERWRNNERLLAPNENPLKLLLKWGEYANDVQFILQRSQNKQEQHQQTTGCNNDRRNSQKNAVMLKRPLSLSTNKNNSRSSNQNMNINTITPTTTNNNSIERASSVPSHQQQQTQEQSHNECYMSQDRKKEFKCNFSSYDSKQNENIGVVKGVPHRLTTNVQVQLISISTSPASCFPSALTSHPLPNNSPIPPLIPKHEKSHSNPTEMPTTQSHALLAAGDGAFDEENNIYHKLGAYNSKSINEINLAEVRSSLNRCTGTGSPGVMFTTNNKINNNNSNENLLDIYSSSVKYNAPPDLFKTATTISANGALVPPPYRDPPPPRNSPLQTQQRLSTDNTSTAGQKQSINSFANNCSIDYDVELDNLDSFVADGTNIEESESIFQATQYKDLVHLIKFQREKISTQQLELSKYDAEIGFLEIKELEQANELDAISREITKLDQIFRQGSEQLQTLQYVEEENELVKQQEKTLKSEIALLRSKLANCETELLQCKNKIRILMDDMEEEQRTISNQQKNNRQNVERDFLIEMECIQSEIDQAIHNTDTSNKTTENLKMEITLIENAIVEKKRQIEQLVNEMKEVNLQSLTVTTSEEIKHLLEGSSKPGSTRRIIGSPRQLENAVPTSKNPHGVWV